MSELGKMVVLLNLPSSFDVFDDLAKGLGLELFRDISAAYMISCIEGWVPTGPANEPLEFVALSRSQGHELFFNLMLMILNRAWEGQAIFPPIS